MSLLMLRALEPSVQCHKFPKAVVDVYATILESGGSARFAAESSPLPLPRPFRPVHPSTPFQSWHPLPILAPWLLFSPLPPAAPRPPLPDHQERSHVLHLAPLEIRLPFRCRFWTPVLGAISFCFGATLSSPAPSAALLPHTSLSMPAGFGSLHIRGFHRPCNGRCGALRPRGRLQGGEARTSAGTGRQKKAEGKMHG